MRTPQIKIAFAQQDAQPLASLTFQPKLNNFYHRLDEKQQQYTDVFGRRFYAIF